MSSQDSEPTPEVIAHKFAESYYGMLVQEDLYEKLTSYYDKSAVCTRGDEAGGHRNHVTITGKDNIKRELERFHKEVRNCQVKLTVMDSQRSVGGGVLLTVIGAFLPNVDTNSSGNENSGVTSRRFVQTFFLATENAANYYIRNDIFRYLAETSVNSKELPAEAAEAADKSALASTMSAAAPPASTVPAAASTASASAPATIATTSPATAITEGIKENKQPVVLEKEAPTATKKEEKKDDKKEEKQEEKKEDKKKVPTAQQNGTSTGKSKEPSGKESVKEKENVKSVPEPKKSQTWANVVGQSLPKDSAVAGATSSATPTAVAVTSGSSTASTPSLAPVSAVAASASATTTITTTTSVSSATSTAADNVTGKSVRHPRGRPDLEIDYERSLYVGNLPYQATRDQVLAIFSKYGKVLQVSLMPYGYGFIDFETPQDVQKVLKAATDNPRHFTMDARPLIVQERHPDSDGSGRRGSRRVFSNRGPRARIPHRQ